MILRILGCGTSTGVPVPGCDCRVCRSANPRNHRLRASALIAVDARNNILIDASTDLRQQALRLQLKHISAVFFTHAHADHILGIDDLRCFNFVRKAPIPCYATAETWSDIRQVFCYLFRHDPTYEGGGVAELEVHEVTEGSSFEVCGLRVVPLGLQHGRKRVTGYRIGDLAYLTDCKSIPPESLELLRGVRQLVLDGLRYKDHNTHFTIPEAIEAARQIAAEQTFLTHMTHTVEYDEVSALLPQGVALAYDGLEIDFAP